ncbi:MAG TPA: helix-turn-helix domain-containing protein [Allocoleopsis sp.]
MTQLIYTPEEKKIFNYERFNHPHPRVQLKMEVLWLKSQGMSNSQIAIFANICENTVRKYLKEYAECGLEKLK